MWRIATLCLLALLQSCTCFVLRPSSASVLRRKLVHATPAGRGEKKEENPSWQKQIDALLNLDTPCASRASITRDLIQRRSEIAEDVTASISSRNISYIAPSSTEYGKSIAGLVAFQKQIIRDILPDIVDNLPSILPQISELAQDTLSSAPKIASAAAGRARSVARDPSQLAELAKEAQKEVKNIISRTPEGLETPDYTVEKVCAGYEVRNYAMYSVCTTNMSSSNGTAMMDPRSSARGFNVLASYLFGSNNESRSMSMTTPVLTSYERDSYEMAFVLPSMLTSNTAPRPTDPAVYIRDILPDRVAAREFPGIATDGEIRRQRTALEAALARDGELYNAKSIRVLQYNPPYTLPWLRRNELVVSLLPGAVQATEVVEATIESFTDSFDSPSDTADD